MKTKLKFLTLAAAGLAIPAIASADAAATWTAKCKMCHGADGNGSATSMGQKYNIKDYTSAEVQAAMKDEEIFEAIKNGVPDTKMPGYSAKGLSDDDITALVAYIRTLKKG